MKILELRPAWVRLFAGRPPAREPFPLGGWGRLLGAIIRRRARQRPVPPRTPFLISVGNLALGGTGKTPVVMDLTRRFGAAGVRGAILTRGYGSGLKGPLVITDDNPAAGDEARLMATEAAPWRWPVIQSSDRSLGLEFLRAEYPDTQVALLEDAHQSARLARHLDLLILDAWGSRERDGQPRLVPRTGPVFPLGPWRENATGARRAAALLVETSVPVPAISIHGQPVFAFSRRTELRWRKPGPADPAQPRRWGLISGIARPEGFEQAALEICPGRVVMAARCRDHAPYDARLVARILAGLNEQGVTAIATTAKDWVKLAPLWRDDRPLAILDLRLVWRQENALDHWLAERAGLPFSKPISWD